MRIREETTGQWAVVFVCLVTLGLVVGLVAGAVYGVREYQAAVDAANREGLTGDYLPVGVPIRAAFGAIIGFTAGAAVAACCLPLMVAWRAFAARGKNRRVDDLS